MATYMNQAPAQMTTTEAEGVLQIPSGTTDRAVIMKEYRKQTKIWHPNWHSGAGEYKLRIAKYRMVQINNAKDVLLPQDSLQHDS